MKGIVEIKIKVDGQIIKLKESEYNKILDNREHLTLKEYIKKNIKDFTTGGKNERSE